MHTRRALIAAFLCSLGAAFAAEPGYTGLLNGFPFPKLGPCGAGAWVADIAVPETPEKAHLRTFYVAARTGGVWKTVNNGTTFQPMTDADGLTSIGALAVAP